MAPSDTRSGVGIDLAVSVAAGADVGGKWRRQIEWRTASYDGTAISSASSTCLANKATSIASGLPRRTAMNTEYSKLRASNVGPRSDGLARSAPCTPARTC